MPTGMLEQVQRLAGRVRWYVRGVTGSDAYDNYLRCHAARGDTTAPMTESQFWRDRYERQQHHPEGRCC